MLFKTEKIKSDWETFESPFPEEQRLLRLVLTVIEGISLLLRFGEVTITSYLRESPGSYHDVAYGLAADVRVKDKSPAFYVIVVAIFKLIESVNKKIRIQPHYELYGKEQQHIHVEVRTH